MYTIYLCDDNQIILQKYDELIRDIAAKHNISINVSTFSSGEQLIFNLSDSPNRADIIYLDILMGKLNGVETAKNLRANGCNSEIIFLTSSSEYVFDSFDIQPLHYIVKNDTTKKKFEKIFLKAISIVEKREKEVFICERNAITKKIPLDSISYFEINNRIIEVHYDDKTFDFYSSMEKLEKQLVNKGFARSHRAIMVNLRYVDRIAKDEITLTDGTKLQLGSTYAKSFKSNFTQFLMSFM